MNPRLSITGRQGITPKRRELLELIADHPRVGMAELARRIKVGRNALHYRYVGLELLGLALPLPVGPLGIYPALTPAGWRALGRTPKCPTCGHEERAPSSPARRSS